LFFARPQLPAKHGTECGGDSCAHPRAEQSRACNEQVGLAKKPQDFISVTLPTQKPEASVRVGSDFTEEL
jgi:hypothetical protein